MKNRPAGSGGDELQVGSMLDRMGRLPSGSILSSGFPLEGCDVTEAYRDIVALRFTALLFVSVGVAFVLLLFVLLLFFQT